MEKEGLSLKKKDFGVCEKKYEINQEPQPKNKSSNTWGHLVNGRVNMEIQSNKVKIDPQEKNDDKVPLAAAGRSGRGASSRRRRPPATPAPRRPAPPPAATSPTPAPEAIWRRSGNCETQNQSHRNEFSKKMKRNQKTTAQRVCGGASTTQIPNTMSR